MQLALDKVDGKKGGSARIASLCGRYYAMDRDQRWDRVQKAYDLYTQGSAEAVAPDALWGLEQAYQRGETDEFVKPTIIGAGAAIADGDAVIYMNFRADRARQLTQVFVEPAFAGFPRPRAKAQSAFLTFTG